MLDIVNLSKNMEKNRRNSMELLTKMETASKGQNPPFLIISTIRRSSQDLELFGMKQGDAFQGTRVPNHPLLIPQKSRLLYAGPAAYNSHFSKKAGVIVTFESDEPEDLIKQTISNLSGLKDVEGIPILAYRVNYGSGEVGIIEHSNTRNMETEQKILSKVTKPNGVDQDVIILMCSDSRLLPPVTSKGHPMTIRTLGGYISEYNGFDDETQQLDIFLKEWFTNGLSNKRIFVIAHGKIGSEGQHCGAGAASLAPENIHGDYLKPVIEILAKEASSFEEAGTKTPEERVISISHSIKHNLSTYPSVKSAIGKGLKLDTLVQIGLMDTVSGIIVPQ